MDPEDYGEILDIQDKLATINFRLKQLPGVNQNLIWRLEIISRLRAGEMHSLLRGQIVRDVGDELVGHGAQLRQVEHLQVYGHALESLGTRLQQLSERFAADAFEVPFPDPPLVLAQDWHPIQHDDEDHNNHQDDEQQSDSGFGDGSASENSDPDEAEEDLVL